MLKLLLDLNILSATQCDQATQEFETFMDDDVKIKTLAFSSFDEETTSLDHFYFKIIMVGRYEVLSFIIVRLGQAIVERGFILNNSVNQTNIAPETIISKRLIKDYILANKITVDKVDNTRDMIKTYTKSHML